MGSMLASVGWESWSATVRRVLSPWFVLVGQLAGEGCPNSGLRQNVDPDSDVEKADVLGVGLDERPAGFDVVTHQLCEDLVSDGCVLHGDLEERACDRVHRRLLQLLPVHLTQALEPVHLEPAPFMGSLEGAQRRVVLEVMPLLADISAVERRLRQIDTAELHELGELTVEERQQKRANVRTVDVGVTHQDDLVVANLRSLEVRSDARADRADERLDLLVLEHAVDASALDVENLAANRKDRLGSGVTRLLRGSPGAVTLHDEELTLVGVLGRAVGELSRHRVAVEQRLAPREVACLARGDTGPRRLHRLLQDRASLRRMLIEPIREFLVCGLLDQRTHLGVAKLRLGLPLELRVAQLHRDDRGEAFTNV